MGISRFCTFSVGIAVVAAILVIVGNLVLYHATRPSELDHAQWTGTWTSESYTPLAGRIVADLPDPLPDGELEANAWVYYNLWSAYRPGRSSVLELRGRVVSGDGAAVNEGRRLSLDGKLPGGLVVSYRAAVSTNGRIVGTYEAIPADRGSFELSR